MKLINKILFYLEIVFLLITFSLAVYIGLIRMDYDRSSYMTIIPIAIPFILLLTIYVFTIFFNWDNKSIFINISSLLCFIAIILIAIRTIFDHNVMITAPFINVSFYKIQEGRIKILLYLMITGNVLLTYYKNKIHS